MNGQIDRLKTLLYSKDELSFNNVYCFLSASKSIGKNFVLYKYAKHFSINKENILILNYNIKNNNKIFDVEEIISFETFQKNNANEKGNVFVYNISDNIEEKKNSDDSILFEIISNYHDYFDKIFINVKSGIDNISSSLFKYAKKCIIVSKTDPICIVDTYALIKILVINKFYNKIEIIFNYVQSEDDFIEAAENLRKAVNHFLNKEIDILFGIPLISNNESLQQIMIKPFSISLV